MGIYSIKYWKEWERLHPGTYKHLIEDITNYENWKLKQKGFDIGESLKTK